MTGMATRNFWRVVNHIYKSTALMIKDNYCSIINPLGVEMARVVSCPIVG